ncbi:MAG: hypothetical protein KH366_17990 [Clostridiaceae bacterium]|nr:hypothetical protein [Clostridiaceae bacterium]
MNPGKMGCGAVWDGGGGFSPEGAGPAEGWSTVRGFSSWWRPGQFYG